MDAGARRTGQDGFTLIEMAFTVALISLFVGGGLMVMTPSIDKTRQLQTNANLDKVEAALALFVIRNSRLPCPADASLPNTNAKYGDESAQSNTGLQINSCNLTVANSVIPWITLGIDERFSIDGWGNRFAYFPANDFIAGINSLVDSSLNCMWRNYLPSGTAPSLRSAACDVPFTPAGSNPTSTQYNPSYPYGNYIAVYAAANPYGAELTTPQPVAAITSATAANAAGLRAAYVLISHGRSGWYGWPKGGTRQVLPPTLTPAAPFIVKQYNSNGSAGAAGALGFVQGNPIGAWPPGKNQSYFDDIVRWRSPAYLIQQCRATACGNP